jgi:hypothetical protein
MKTATTDRDWSMKGTSTKATMKLVKWKG